jgi:RNA polymerase sigma-70 factor (ECF subfamily)
MRRTHINGQPGALFLDPDGRLLYLMELDIADGLVQTVRAVINQRKLSHLGPFGDIRALRKAMRQSPSRPA